MSRLFEQRVNAPAKRQYLNDPDNAGSDVKNSVHNGASLRQYKG